MKRSVRDCLADLLFRGFNQPEKRVALAWLALFCDLAERRGTPEVPLTDLLHEGSVTLSRMDGDRIAALSHVIGPKRLLRLRRADTGEVFAVGIPRRTEQDVPWLVEPELEVRADFVEVRARAQTYAALVSRIGGGDLISRPKDSLHRALAEAALCFNVGLFFEAHEHLEHHWVLQPKGPTKRFLQGIIQISVGFHHAREGNYDGVVNQLAKGLEKLTGITGEVLGLDCDDFLPRVVAAQEGILARGRAGMTPLLLAEIPRMPIRG